MSGVRRPDGETGPRADADGPRVAVEDDRDRRSEGRTDPPSTDVSWVRRCERTFSPRPRRVRNAVDGDNAAMPDPEAAGAPTDDASTTGADTDAVAGSDTDPVAGPVADADGAPGVRSGAD